MRKNGIVVERTRKFKATTDSDHMFNVAPNLLNRDLTADRPDQNRRSAQRNVQVTSAISGPARYEMNNKTDWRTVCPSIGLFLAVIRDRHSRRVIGRAVSNSMNCDVAIRALRMAIALRSPPKGCIVHSDRGSQYCLHRLTKHPKGTWPSGVNERQKQLL